MKGYELFSKRQKRLRGEVPDVYQYEDIPQELRVQVVHIWRDVLRTTRSGFTSGFYEDAYRAYYTFHDVLCREYGMFELGDGHQPHPQRVIDYFIGAKETERALDVIEVSFQYIDKDVRDNPSDYFHSLISPEEAINELNYRFREHGVGYQYESGQIIKMDSQFTHSEVVKPALIMLSDPIYKGANEEFLEAHEHYRKGRYKECLNDCLKAFESCMKIICGKRGWPYNEKDTANRLIETVFKHTLIDSSMTCHFTALISTLKSGVPTVRNDQSAHGQGSEDITVPEYIASYILHLTASNILLLVNAEENMK